MLLFGEPGTKNYVKNIIVAIVIVLIILFVFGGFITGIVYAAKGPPQKSSFYGDMNYDATNYIYKDNPYSQNKESVMDLDNYGNTLFS